MIKEETQGQQGYILGISIIPTLPLRFLFYPPGEEFIVDIPDAYSETIGRPALGSYYELKEKKKDEAVILLSNFNYAENKKNYKKEDMKHFRKTLYIT